MFPLVVLLPLLLWHSRKFCGVLACIFRGLSKLDLKPWSNFFISAKTHLFHVQVSMSCDFALGPLDVGLLKRPTVGWTCKPQREPNRSGFRLPKSASEPRCSLGIVRCPRANSSSWGEWVGSLLKNSQNASFAVLRFLKQQRKDSQKKLKKTMSFVNLWSRKQHWHTSIISSGLRPPQPNIYLPTFFIPLASLWLLLDALPTPVYSLFLLSNYWSHSPTQLKHNLTQPCTTRTRPTWQWDGFLALSRSTSTHSPTSGIKRKPSLTIASASIAIFGASITSSSATTDLHPKRPRPLLPGLGSRSTRKDLSGGPSRSRWALDSVSSKKKFRHTSRGAMEWMSSGKAVNSWDLLKTNISNFAFKKKEGFGGLENTSYSVLTSHFERGGLVQTLSNRILYYQNKGRTGSRYLASGSRARQTPMTTQKTSGKRLQIW